RPTARRREVRLVGVMRIRHVEKDEEGHVTVRLQPRQEPVDVLASGLARSSLRQRRALVHLLEALVEVRELAREKDRRERQRGVAPLTIDVGPRPRRGWPAD